MGIVLAAGAIAGCKQGDDKPAAAPPPKAAADRPAGPSLKEARAAFQTKPAPTTFKPSGRTAPPESAAYKLVKYPSPAGNLAAYVTADPGGGKRQPLVVFAHGGFGSIDPEDLDRGTVDSDQGPDSFREAGFAVLYPSRRGENDNPGRFDLYYGEVDDLLAAVAYGKTLPYVDPARVYLMGHSSGGTLALLAAEMGAPVRAVFSFGGDPTIEGQVDPDDGMFNGRFTVPFDRRDPQELRLRSPEHWVRNIRVPTFYLEGEHVKVNVPGAQRMAESAARFGVPLSVHIIPGGTHVDLKASKRLIAAKLLADTGPACAVALTDAELQQAYEAVWEAKASDVPPFARATPEAVALAKSILARAKKDDHADRPQSLRVWATPDGDPRAMVDAADDIDDVACTIDGVRFVTDRATLKTLGQVSLSVVQENRRRTLKVERAAAPAK
ncbi:MAG TPA: prolyl oligopeptidase family serine peptidase [Humisphaera sp.]